MRGVTQGSALTAVRVLGGFELTVDGAPVAVPMQAQRVASFLSVVGPTRREVLAGRLWPYSPQARAQANLRTAVWRIRQATPSFFGACRDVLTVDAQVDVDVHRANTLARQLTMMSCDALPTGRDAELLEHDLLPDWDETWLIVERERLRQTRIHALEALSRQLTKAGLYGDAIDAALSAIAAEPLRESAHAALIQAYLAEGNPSEATREFNNYARLLKTDLGLEPSTSLRQLVNEPQPSSATHERQASLLR